MDLKGLSEDCLRQLKFLEEEKIRVQEMLIASIKDFPESVSENFIDWFYWESGLSIDILAKGTGISKAKITKMIYPLAVEYICRCCKKTKFILCNNKSEKEEIGRKKIKCSDCEQEEERKKKELKISKARKAEEKAKNKNAALHTMPYEEFLLTKYWTLFAKRCRSKAGHRCQKCKIDGVPLHVHHLTYERRGYERDEDVIVLCENCHRKEHGLPALKVLPSNNLPLKERVAKLLAK